MLYSSKASHITKLLSLSLSFSLSFLFPSTLTFLKASFLFSFFYSLSFSFSSSSLVFFSARFAPPFFFLLPLLSLIPPSRRNSLLGSTCRARWRPSLSDPYPPHPPSPHLSLKNLLVKVYLSPDWNNDWIQSRFLFFVVVVLLFFVLSVGSTSLISFSAPLSLCIYRLGYFFLFSLLHGQV